MNMNVHDKILLLVPAETASGGIKNYFQVLKDNFTLPIVYMIRGARNWPYRNSFINEILRAYKDFIKFKKKIKNDSIKLVQTSTSLGLFSVIRDGLFILYANKKGIKTIVFFRGWDKNFEQKLERYFLAMFKYFFFRTDSIIVLASDFQNKLIQWGYLKRINIESTIIDEGLIDNISFKTIEKLRSDRVSKKEVNILFLARIEIPKGVYEVIKTFLLLSNLNSDFRISLKFAGSGKELENLKQYVRTRNYKNIEFLGHIEGENKRQAFLNSDFYLFPTYTEGMPNSVLEAMAFGLPIITRKVGAIPDIITIGENGFYTDSKEPKVFASFIQKLLDNRSLYTFISKNNYNKAIENYTTKKVVKRIENIYKNILNETAYPTT